MSLESKYMDMTIFRLPMRQFAIKKKNLNWALRQPLQLDIEVIVKEAIVHEEFMQDKK
jgi:hypothetical protein